MRIVLAIEDLPEQLRDVAEHELIGKPTAAAIVRQAANVIAGFLEAEDEEEA